MGMNTDAHKGKNEKNLCKSVVPASVKNLCTKNHWPTESVMKKMEKIHVKKLTAKLKKNLEKTFIILLRLNFPKPPYRHLQGNLFL